MATYLPEKFRDALTKAKAKKVDPKKLAKDLAENKVELAKGEAPFITAKVNRERYGFTLPKQLNSLLDVADTIAIEDVETKGFRYCRVAPMGWEMPAQVTGENYFNTLAKRFQWNTFSNVQILEHLIGLMPLGWDDGDNRYEVSTLTDEAPVFWMDNETADLYGPVASSLSNFLATQMGETKSIPKNERLLSLKPSHWGRSEDELSYLARDLPLRSWPSFHAARSSWLLAEMFFEDSKQQRKKEETQCFDFATESKYLSENEPLALYWLFRSFLLDEKDILEETMKKTKAFPSLLVTDLIALLELRRNQTDPKGSAIVRARNKLKKEAKTLRKAKWMKSLSASDL